MKNAAKISPIEIIFYNKKRMIIRKKLFNCVGNN